MDQTVVSTLQQGREARLFRLPWPRARPAPLTPTELQTRYLAVVLNYVVARLGQGPEAEDVAAEVFAAVFAAMHRCPRPVAGGQADDPVRAYLFGIARRKVADTLRRRSRHPETTLESATETVTTEAGPEAHVLQNEAGAVLTELLERLPEDQREALRLKYIEELSLQEIGQAMRRSPAAVGALLHRARRAVREQGRGYFDVREGGEE